MITKFFDDPNEKMLLMTVPATGVLTPLTSFSPIVKQKFTYFIRKKKEPITMENFRKVVSFGDMGGKPIEELAVLMEGVFVPILSNPKNQEGWPKVVCEDVVAHVRTFKNTVDQVRNYIRTESTVSKTINFRN